MPRIDWDGFGVDYFSTTSSLAPHSDEGLDVVLFEEMDAGMHVQYEASRGRTVDIHIIGKVAVFPSVMATQHVPGGHTRVARGQLRGCDDGMGGNAIALALAAEHAPVLYSGRAHQEIRLPFAVGRLFVENARVDI